MNKELKGLIKEISIIFMLIAISVILLPTIVNGKIALKENLLNYSQKLEINITKKSKYNLFPMTDTYAINNLSNSTITINNKTKDKEKYNVVLKVNKSSNIGINNIKVKVEDNILKLDNYYYQDENNYYYKVYSDNLDSNKQRNINYMLWLDENTETINGNNLIYSFEIENL